jgi:hypothetical protein
LRIAGLGDLGEAKAILTDEHAPVDRRCLAALAIGLLGNEIRDAGIREEINSCDIVKRVSAVTPL